MNILSSNWNREWWCHLTICTALLLLQWRLLSQVWLRRVPFRRVWGETCGHAVLISLIPHHITLPHLIVYHTTLPLLLTVTHHQLFVPLHLALPVPILFSHFLISLSHSWSACFHPLILQPHHHCLSLHLTIPSKPSNIPQSAPRGSKWVKYVFSKLFKNKELFILWTFSHEEERESVKKTAICSHLLTSLCWLLYSLEETPSNPPGDPFCGDISHPSNISHPLAWLLHNIWFGIHQCSVNSLHMMSTYKQTNKEKLASAIYGISRTFYENNTQYSWVNKYSLTIKPCCINFA